MKKIVFTIALAFGIVANASALRIFNSQVINFNKVDKDIYSCDVVLQQRVVTCYINKELMELIKANRVALDLKWERVKGNKDMSFYLLPTFKSIPR